MPDQPTDATTPRKRRAPVKVSGGLQTIAYRDGKLKVSCETPTSLRTIEVKIPKGCSQEDLHQHFLRLADEYKPAAVAEAEKPAQPALL